ncbi:cellulose-binding protein, partial [Streptomyces sp. Tu 6176]
MGSTASSVSLHGFAVVRGRCYRPDQVNTQVDVLFVDRDAAWERAARLTVLARNMEAELAALRERAAGLGEQTYASLGEGARSLHEHGQQEARAVRERALREAREQYEAARAYADGLLQDARAYADAVCGAAEEEARRRTEA